MYDETAESCQINAMNLEVVHYFTFLYSASEIFQLEFKWQQNQILNLENLQDIHSEHLFKKK